MSSELKVEKKLNKKKSTYVFLGIISLSLLIFLIYLFVISGKESTEDATIASSIVSVSPRIPGQIEKILVQENTFVKKGDVIVKLNNDREKLDVDLAESDYYGALAGFEQAVVDVKNAKSLFYSSKSAVDLAKKNLDRMTNLKNQGATSELSMDEQRTKYDQALANYESAKTQLSAADEISKYLDGGFIKVKDKVDVQKISQVMRGYSPILDAAIAKLKRAKAAFDLAQINLKDTEILAPTDGYITNKSCDVGKFVGTGSQLFSLVSSEQPWVIANFKETQLEKMKPGQKVKIEVDTYPSVEFVGVITNFSGASKANFALLPPDNSSGNFIKVTQRFSVRIDFTEKPKEIIRPGMSVEVTVYTSQSK